MKIKDFELGENSTQKIINVKPIMPTLKPSDYSYQTNKI